ncbi:MAG TPA: Gldg family protein [Deltaproteobacteria bacterium]|nr:Gldg family protein [Deltaproteobacteria bacterium]HOM29038.1 Gldg family protein [Deltaproteobacteria bacterium]HPP80004.1 Gldg family protein [Deltaproteobacteria bacterium]
MRAQRHGRIVKFLVYLALVILINAAASTLFLRFDLTANRMYSLSEVSKTVVGSLKEPMTINVFFTPDLPAPYNTVEQYLRDLLSEYALYANKSFNYRFYRVGEEDAQQPDVGVDTRRLASDYGITPVQIQVVEKDEVKFKRAYMGLAIVHGDMIERIPALTTTEGLEYKLTTSMQKLANKISVLSGLKDKVEVKLYLSSSLEAVSSRMSLKDLDRVPAQVEKAVGDLNARLFNAISYRRVDLDGRQAMEEASRTYNLMMLTWPDLDGGRVKAGAGLAGMVVEYGGRSYTIPVIQAYTIPLFGTQYRLTPVEKMAEALEQSIESLVGINETLGYLADKGTLGLYGQPGSSASLNNFQDLASRVYTIKEITLDKGIPEGLGCLLIVRPTEAFTDYELFQIDQALMRGTNIAVLLDPFVERPADPNQPMQPGQLMPVTTGIERLLAHYGVKVEMSLVCDLNSFKQRMPEQYGGGEQAIYYAPLIKPSQINHEPRYMKNINELITYKIAPLSLDTTRMKENNLEATVLFTTSDKAWELKNPTMLNPMFVREPGDPSSMGTRTLACLVQGAFPSYFAGKDIPAAPPAHQGEGASGAQEGGKAASPALGHGGAVLERSRPAKLLVIGSSEMITDNLVTEEGTNPNAVFLMNLIDVLNNREEIAVMRAKTQTINPLEVTDENVRLAAKAFNVLGLPVLVILSGIVVWAARAARKKRIDAMFSRRADA